MVQSHSMPTPRRRLVGQPLLYAISVFASLGVFLVSSFGFMIPGCTIDTVQFGYDQGYALMFLKLYVLDSHQCHEWDHHGSSFSQIFQLSQSY
jgi:hypothetical protein